MNETEERVSTSPSLISSLTSMTKKTFFSFVRFDFIRCREQEKKTC